MKPQDQQRRTMTLSDLASPLSGCCNYFDNCSDELMTLSFQGQLGLVDWLGWEVSDVCHQVFEYITYVRPAIALQGPTPGWITDPCADPNGIEYGAAELTVDDFGRLGRKGPTREIMKPKFYCKTSPRKRLDGSPITDEREWDIRFATEVLIQDLRRLIVTGNATTPGQFDGLQRWVRNGYTSSMLDSIVIDMNGNGANGGAGMTWNGAAIPATAGLIDILLAVFRRFKQRIGWSPMLMSQRLAVGDLILVLPTHVIDCVLNAFTCWSVCPGGQYNEVNINGYEARNFRQSLNGGMFGYGAITLDGFTIPLMAYDWELIDGPTLSDMYFLFGSVGSQRVWQGQHISATEVARMYGGSGYFSLDGGRLLGKTETENECTEMKVWMHPRLVCTAPWLQCRIENFKCVPIGGIISPDPLETSFYPLTSFTPAECP